MARTVADVALLDAVLTDQWQRPQIALANVRIGIPRKGFWDDADPGVARCAQAALDEMARAGAALIEVELFDTSVLNADTGFLLGRFEMSEDLPAFLASIGMPMTLAELHGTIASPDVAESIATRLQASAIGIDGYREAQRWRASLQATYAAAFQTHRLDALAFPTSLLTPPLIGQDKTVRLNGQERALFPVYARSTSPASLAGLPGISIPVGMLDGLPVGLELDGPPHSDRLLLALAARLEQLAPEIMPPNSSIWRAFA